MNINHGINVLLLLNNMLTARQEVLYLGLLISLIQKQVTAWHSQGCRTLVIDEKRYSKDENASENSLPCKTNTQKVIQLLHIYY